MAKKVIQMYDKYQSTTKVYPLIIGDSLTEDAITKIESMIPEGIPTIEIAVSQMLSENTAQLTDEQYKILSSNLLCSIKILSNNNLLFLKSLDTESTLSYCYYQGSVNPTQISLYNVSIAKSTKIATIENDNISGGKQLYAHYIQLVVDSSTAYAEITLQIINDSNVAFTKDSLATYATYSADRPINNIIANGYWFDKTNTKQYRVNKLYNYNGLQWGCTDCNVTSVAGSSIAPIYANFTYTISDSIIAL